MSVEAGGSTDTAGRVLATGTFDILHPGHVHYLEGSAALGNELHVIVSRDERVDHKDPVIHERQRLEMVASLGVVDDARLGSERSIFEPLSEIRPDTVTLGHDQHYDADELEGELRERGYDADVVRLSGREPEDHEILSTTSIIDRILDRADDVEDVR